MTAIDFDAAMNESKRPRKEEDAGKKKQEKEDLKAIHVPLAIS